MARPFRVLRRSCDTEHWLMVVCLLLLPCLAGSCSSTPSTVWQPKPPGDPITWRQFSLYRGDAAFVLASKESAASEVHLLVERARAAVEASGAAQPDLGLVIALTKRDALLFENAEDHESALRRWGGKSGMQIELRSQEGDSGEPLDFDKRLMYQLVPVAVPTDDTDLDLPAALREQFTHVLIAPTDALIESTMGEMIKASFDAKEIGWAQRQLVYAIANPKAMMVERLTPEIRSGFVHAWAMTAGLSKAQINLVRTEFGLKERSDQRAAEADRQRRGLLPLDVAREHLEELEGLVVDDELQLGVSTSPATHFLLWIRSMDWKLAVDLNPAPAYNAHIFQGAPHYEWLPTEHDLPGRSDAEAFEALRLKHPGFALVSEKDPSRAAALLAAHSFWVRDLDADAAVALGLRFGLDPELADSVRAFFVR